MPRHLPAARAKAAGTLGCLLALGRARRSGPVSDAVLEVTDLKKHFPVKRGIIHRTVGQVYAAVGGRKQKTAALFEQVGLSAAQMKSFPHEFSGGQRQRISIARALALNPKLIVADEPVSALDVSIQAQVINLMMHLQREKRLSYLFIAHGLAVVEHISHRVAVMYLGKIVEYAQKKTLFLNPLHPYTEALLAAVPIPNPKLKRAKRPLAGDVPSPMYPPSGCAFHTRCGYAQERCRRETPPLREVALGHWVSCHFR